MGLGRAVADALRAGRWACARSPPPAGTSRPPAAPGPPARGGPSRSLRLSTACAAPPARRRRPTWRLAALAFVPIRPSAPFWPPRIVPVGVPQVEPERAVVAQDAPHLAEHGHGVRHVPLRLRLLAPLSQPSRRATAWGASRSRGAASRAATCTPCAPTAPAGWAARRGRGPAGCARSSGTRHGRRRPSARRRESAPSRARRRAGRGPAGRPGAPTPRPPRRRGRRTPPRPAWPPRPTPPVPPGTRRPRAAAARSPSGLGLTCRLRAWSRPVHRPEWSLALAAPSNQASTTLLTRHREALHPQQRPRLPLHECSHSTVLRVRSTSVPRAAPVLARLRELQQQPADDCAPRQEPVGTVGLPSATARPVLWPWHDPPDARLKDANLQPRAAAAHAVQCAEDATRVLTVEGEGMPEEAPPGGRVSLSGLGADRRRRTPPLASPARGPGAPQSPAGRHPQVPAILAIRASSSDR